MGPTGSRHHASVWIDSAGVFGVVVGLCLVHFGLPTPVHEKLVFQYGNPIALTPWTAVLVHDSIRHLASNLLAYLVIIEPTYALYRTWGRRRRFWLLMGSVIVVIPPLITAADYWLLYQRWRLAGPQTVGFGFSGVVSGLVGVLAVSTIGAVADWYGQRSAVFTAVALAGGCSAGVLVSTEKLLATPSVLLLSIGLFVAGGAGIVRQWRSTVVETSQQVSRDRLWIIGTCLLVTWVLTVTLLEVEAGIESRFVDVVAHATGLFTGVSLTTWCTMR